MRRFSRKIGAILLVVAVLTGSFNTPVQAAEKDSMRSYTIEQNGSSMRLNWNDVSGASSYKLYRADSRYGNYTYLGTVDGTNYTDTRMNANKYSNYYKVVAMNGNTEVETRIMSLENQLFGDNMIFFAPSDNVADINDKVAEIYAKQEKAQFGTGRYALLFKNGDYTATDSMNVGFYTSVAGLGKLPTDVKLTNAKTPAYLSDNNATCNFWRSIENVQISDLDNNSDVYFSFQWAVSQAAPARRLYVERNASFDWWYGWASGGYAADSMFLKNAGSYSQQQYYMRNSTIGGDAYGVNWNFVLQGVEGGNLNANTPLLSGNGMSDWASGGKTTLVDNSPVIREKPFLYLDGDEYKVFVPGIRRNARGTSWTKSDMGNGKSLSIDSFYIAKEGDSAADINAALDAGKNVFFTPGIYYAEEPIRVTKPDTVVLGYGLATIIPKNNQAAMWVDDVDGVTVAGLIFDASTYSQVLLQVGNKDASADHSANPILLADLFFRVGGVYDGTASTDLALVVNSDDVIGDHFWIWRADHGDGVSWNGNPAQNGLVVNGDDVTVYGLFNEHFEEYGTLWLGENGKCYFYQYETPYDCVNQNDWKSHNGSVNGYAAYKVGNNVNKHYVVGLDIYEVFINTNGAEVHLNNAIEIPNKPEVIVENAMINTFSSKDVKGSIDHIVNDTGSGQRAGVMECPGVVSAVNGVTTIRPNKDNGDTYKTVNSVNPADEIFVGKTGIDYKYSETNPQPPVIPDKDKLKIVKATASTGDATQAVDGNMGSRWESVHGEDPQWIMFELEGLSSVSQVKIDWETAAAKEYTIQVSTDGNSFADVYTVTGGTNGAILDAEFDAVDAKYVRIYGTERTTIWGYSIWESEIYGSKYEEDDKDKDKEKLVKLSGTASASTEFQPAQNALDENEGSRWESVHGEDPQWITVDFGAVKSVSQIKLNWEIAAAKNYEIQLSTDNSNWTTVRTVTDGVNGEKKDISFDKVDARYVRIYGTERTTGYGYSIWEIEIYGN